MHLRWSEYKWTALNTKVNSHQDTLGSDHSNHLFWWSGMHFTTCKLHWFSTEEIKCLCSYIISHLFHLLWLCCHWEYLQVKDHFITALCMWILFKQPGSHHLFSFQALIWFWKIWFIHILQTISLKDDHDLNQNLPDSACKTTETGHLMLHKYRIHCRAFVLSWYYWFSSSPSLTVWRAKRTQFD